MIIDSDDLERYAAGGWATNPAAFSQCRRERELRERLKALEKEALGLMDEINRLRNDGPGRQTPEGGRATAPEADDGGRPAKRRRKV